LEARAEALKQELDLKEAKLKSLNPRLGMREVKEEDLLENLSIGQEIVLTVRIELM